jgi:uncharacterized protein (TIGR00297 family)
MDALVRWGSGVLLSLGFGAGAYALKAIDRAGYLAGVLVGIACYGGFGIGGFAVLALFFALGTAATRVGSSDKEDKGVSQAGRGRRTTRHVLANGMVAGLCGLIAAVFPQSRDVAGIAFAGALAAATADTLSGEIGQVYGGTPYLLTTLRPVPVGENGGMTMVGTLAGAVGSLVIAVVAWQTGVAARAGAVVLGGVAGNLADSLVGATVERRGWLRNAGVNVVCTITGAGVAVWFHSYLRRF